MTPRALPLVGLAVALVAAACTEPPPDVPARLPPPPQCVPTADGPYRLIEGETVAFTVHCAVAGQQRAGDAFAVVGLPTGATYDPTTAMVRWTPGLDQAAVFELELRARDELITGRVTIAVADAFDTAGNVPPVDPTRYPEELGVPVIFVSPAPRSTTYEPVTVVYRGQTFAATAKLHGASSLSYPEHSYTINFAPGDRFNDPSHAGGFLGKHKLVLISTFDDNTYVRQRLAYELWRTMDPDHVLVRSYSAVLYIDGAFYGLYALTDHPDHNVVGAEGFSEDGNLYKAVSHDANFDTVLYGGGVKTNLHAGYVKTEGLPLAGQPEAYADLESLVTWSATSAPATFATELPDRFDVDDLRDWFVFVTAMLAEDSAGKNEYLYHDPATPGPVRYLPWDYNHSFGQAWQTYRTSAMSWTDFRRNNRLFARMLDDATLGPTLTARYQAMLAGPLSEDAVLAMFDAMVAETAGVAVRNQRKWGAQYRSFSRWSGRNDFLDYAGEVAYTRQWIHTRWAMLRARYPAP